MAYEPSIEDFPQLRQFAPPERKRLYEILRERSKTEWSGPVRPAFVLIVIVMIIGMLQGALEGLFRGSEPVRHNIFLQVLVAGGLGSCGFYLQSVLMPQLERRRIQAYLREHALGAEELRGLLAESDKDGKTLVLPERSIPVRQPRFESVWPFIRRRRAVSQADRARS